MRDPLIWLGVAVLTALALVLAASWVLHSRLQNPQSLRFAGSVSALALSLPLLPFATRLVIMYSDPSNPGQLANWLVISFEILLPSVLGLLAAISFLLVVRTVELPINNSFKPTPLRDAA